MLQKLIEDSRAQLLNKSKHGKEYVLDKSKGKNRYERRLKSSIAKSVNNYNRLDMNKFFKQDTLDVVVKVKGETDNYEVKIRFNGILDELHKILDSGQEFDFRSVSQALIRAFNREDVFIHCSCPDWQYRFNHWATVHDITSGAPEDRPNRFDWTNKNDDMGAACKHVLLVLQNNTWLNKVAAVIRNYVTYMKDHSQKMYADIVYPAIYGRPYEDEVQLSIFDKDDLDTGETDIDTSNKYARERTRFKPGNQSGVQFAKEAPADGKQLDIDSLIDK